MDFGHGRKLEQFGRLLLDRPAPPADGVAPSRPELWSDAQVRWPDRCEVPDDPPWRLHFSLVGSASTDFVAQQPGQQGLQPWQAGSDLGQDLRVHSLSFDLKLTAFGHVGVFPEQAVNWQWLYQYAQRANRLAAEPVECLNLFAYTGGATLAVAAGGGHVVHIDASAPSVQWAKRNALQSGLEDRRIRWIVEDAFKFVQRELRRGRQYDLVIMDPPGYGHGPTGKAWVLADRWQELMSGCLQLLTSSQRAALLWTAHSPTPEVADVVRLIDGTTGQSWNVQYGRNYLTTSGGQRLDQGYCLRALKL